jgi:tetratricopeptide (TPR) repeat protein
VDQPTTDIALALTVLGDALRAGGQFNDAISVYEQCLERFPVHTPAIDGAGVAKLGLADRGLLSHDEVIEWYDRHVQANPRAASTITNRGVALMRRNRPGDEAQAFRDFENAAAVSDRRTAPYEAAGRMLLEKAEGDEDSSTRLSQAGQALKAFQQAFQRATAYYQPAIRNWLSYTYQVLGQCDDAIRQAEDSVQRSPGFPANHQALCCAFLACSQWNRAAAAANEWLTSEYAAQSLPSRIWMGGFLCLAKLCAGADRSAMLDDLHALHSDRLLMPWSGARWKWSPAKQRVLEHMRGKGENQQLAQDIVGLLEGGVSPESFRQRWLR